MCLKANEHYWNDDELRNQVVDLRIVSDKLSKIYSIEEAVVMFHNELAHFKRSSVPARKCCKTHGGYHVKNTEPLDQTVSPIQINSCEVVKVKLEPQMYPQPSGNLIHDINQFYWLSQFINEEEFVKTWVRKWGSQKDDVMALQDKYPQHRVEICYALSRMANLGYRAHGSFQWMPVRSKVAFINNRLDLHKFMNSVSDKPRGVQRTIYHEFIRQNASNWNNICSSNSGKNIRKFLQRMKKLDLSTKELPYLSPQMFSRMMFGDAPQQFARASQNMANRFENVSRQFEGTSRRVNTFLDDMNHNFEQTTEKIQSFVEQLQQWIPNIPKSSELFTKIFNWVIKISALSYYFMHTKDDVNCQVSVVLAAISSELSTVAGVCMPALIKAFENIASKISNKMQAQVGDEDVYTIMSSVWAFLKGLACGVPVLERYKFDLKTKYLINMMSCVNTMANFGDMLIRMFQMLFEKFCIYVVKRADWVPRLAANHKVVRLLERWKNVESDPEYAKFQTNRRLILEAVNIRAELVEIETNIFKQGIDPYKGVCLVYVKSLRVVIDGLLATVPEAMKLPYAKQRTRALWIHMIGAPGVGKSSFISNWLTTALMAKLEPALGYESAKNLCYYRGEAKYWEGYASQPVVVYDDLFQVYRNDELTYQTISELTQICNDGQVPLDMAFTKKGTVFFNSRVILSTGNDDFVNQPFVVQNTLSEGRHLERRRDFVIKIEVDAENMNAATGAIDPARVFQEFDGENPYSVFKPQVITMTVCDSTGVHQLRTGFIEDIMPKLIDDIVALDERRRAATNNMEPVYKKLYERMKGQCLDNDDCDCVEYKLQSVDMPHNHSALVRASIQGKLNIQGDTDRGAFSFVAALIRYLEFYKFLETCGYNRWHYLFPNLDDCTITRAAYMQKVADYLIENMKRNFLFRHASVDVMQQWINNLHRYSGELYIPVGRPKSQDYTYIPEHQKLVARASAAVSLLNLNKYGVNRMLAEIHRIQHQDQFVQEDIMCEKKCVEDNMVYFRQRRTCNCEAHILHAAGVGRRMLISACEEGRHKWEMVARKDGTVCGCNYQGYLPLFKKIALYDNSVADKHEEVAPTFYAARLDQDPMFWTKEIWSAFISDVPVIQTVIIALIAKFAWNRYWDKKKIAPQEYNGMNDTQVCRIDKNVALMTVYYQSGVQRTKVGESSGLAVGKNVIVVPKHYYTRAKQFIDSKAQGMTVVFGVTIGTQVEQIVNASAISWMAFEDDDRDLVCCSVKNLNNVVSMESLFVSESDMPDISASCLYGTRKANNKRSAPMLMTLHSVKAVSNIDYELTGTTINGHVWPLVEIKSKKGYMYSCQGTMAGDCGMVFMHTDSRYAAKLCGIHVAGSGTTGYSECLTREDIRSALEYFDQLPTIQKPQFVDYTIEPGYVIDDTDRLRVLGSAGMFQFADREVSAKNVMPSHTKIKPSMFQDELIAMGIKNYTKPVHLRPFDKDGEKISPLKKSVQKLVTTTLPFDHNVVDDAIEAVLIAIDIGTARADRRILSEDEMIMGMGSLKMIDMSTSPGAPYNKVLSGKSKRVWFNQVGDKFEMGEHLKQQFKQRESSALAGRAIDLVFMDTLKDETQEISKVDNGKARLFQVGPIDLTLLLRKYCGAFISAVQSNPVMSEISIGINPYSLDWHMLHKRLSVHPHVLAGDYSNFDASISHQIGMACADIINDWYGTEDKKFKVLRRTIMSQLFSSVQIANDTVYQMLQGNPSGEALTTIVNCLANMLYMRIAFHDITGMSIGQYSQHVQAAFYGDDSVMTVSKTAFDKNYDMIGLAEFFARYNITYTNARKEAMDAREEQWSNVSYMSNKFAIQPTMGVYVAQKPMPDIIEVLMWSKSDPLNAQDQLQRSNCSLLYSAAYGREVFEGMRKIILKLFRSKMFEGLSINIDELFTYDMCLEIMYPGMDHELRSPVPVGDSLRDPSDEDLTGNPLVLIGDNGEKNISANQEEELQIISVPQPQTASFNNYAAKKNQRKKEGKPKPRGKALEPMADVPSRLVGQFGDENNEVIKAMTQRTMFHHLTHQIIAEARWIKWKTQLIPTLEHDAGLIEDFDMVSSSLHTLLDKLIKVKAGILGYLTRYDATPPVLTPHLTPQMDRIHEVDQITKFDDTVEKHVVETPSHDTRMPMQQIDVTQDAMLKRPVLISTFKWNATDVEGTIKATISLPKDWLTSYIAQKLNGHAFMRTDYKLRVLVNGTRQHYGRLGMCWIPMDNCIDDHYKTASVMMTSPNWAQVDACSDQPVEIFVPYKNIREKYTVNSVLQREDIDQWTVFRVFVTVPLAMVEGIASSVSVSIFAEAVNMELSGYASGSQVFPNQLPLTLAGHIATPSLVAQMDTLTKEAEDKTKKGVVGKTLQTIGKAATFLMPVPEIGPVLAAGGYVTQGLGHVLEYFGLSVPPSTGITNRMQVFPPMTYKSVDTPAAEVMGQSQTDHAFVDYSLVRDVPNAATISYFAQTPALFDTVSWKASDAVGTNLYELPLNPYLWYKTKDTTVANIKRYECTPISRTTEFTKFWRGSLKIHFSMVASRFHSGRLRISYDPTATTNVISVDNAQNLINHVWDINELTDKTIEIPYDQISLWRVCNSTQNGQIGKLAVQVINPLTSSAVTTNSVSFQVFVCGGDDYQVAVPRPMQTTRFFVPPGTKKNAGAIQDKKDGKGMVTVEVVPKVPATPAPGAQVTPPKLAAQSFTVGDSCEYPALSAECIRRTKPQVMGQGVKYMVNNASTIEPIHTWKQLTNMLTQSSTTTFTSHDHQCISFGLGGFLENNPKAWLLDYLTHFMFWRGSMRLAVYGVPNLQTRAQTEVFIGTVPNGNLIYDETLPIPWTYPVYRDTRDNNTLSPADYVLPYAGEFVCAVNTKGFGKTYERAHSRGYVEMWVPENVAVVPKSNLSVWIGGGDDFIMGHQLPVPPRYSA
jgi:hypothetical protein